MDCLSKMFAAFLLVTGLYTTAAFNLLTKPVDNFERDDPLFGQTIVVSNDGIYVPTQGRVFKCRLGSHCFTVNETENVKKGLRPIVSVSSISSEEEEQFLVCNQVQTRNHSSEDFNGQCVHVFSPGVKEDINPAKLVSEQMKTNAHSRKRRQAEPNDEDEDEEEDAGTEIAFVLDGSGSIGPDDFERAKTFIHTVMQNVWTTCFTCNFAIVQFGSNIRTELSLLENEDYAKALNKVKNIKQIYNLTKTASALYHVLTEVFVPENGSNKNSKKMIIVLSDGEMLGTQRPLEEVLNMKEMDGVLRFSIGVGSEVLNSSKAKKEMIQISGSEKRFFNVSSYAALENILSSIEKEILNIEGIKKGAGFHFELAEAGFSSHLTQEGSMLFGAVGAYDWSGGIILKKKEEKSVTFLNATKEEPRFSYLGYSVASARMATKTLYISGAPRYNLTGAVFVFDGTDQELILGDQVGSYFGSVLCTLDIDNNQETDYLLVGAPHFHVKGEEGKVLVYKLHQGQFEREDYVLHGMGKHIYARFGSAIVDIGDIDGNKYRDVAVGAPLEAADELTESSGSIYIYNGFADGIKQQFTQRIAPSDFGMKLVHFGQAVSAMSDSGKAQNDPFISVGSESRITVLKALPVVIIKPAIQLDHTEIPLAHQTNHESSSIVTYIQICFDDMRRKIADDEQLHIEYQIDLDFGKEQKRLVFGDQNEKQTTFQVTSKINCIGRKTLKYVGCNDCFSPIKIKIQFKLLSTPDAIPVRVLDEFSPTEFMTEIKFEKECKDLERCQPKISLHDSQLSDELIIIGSSQSLSMTFNLKNLGSSSYMTTLTLTYPNILQPKKIERGQGCEVQSDNLQITCKLLHPVFRKSANTRVTVDWQPIHSTKSDLTNAAIRAVLTGGNNGTEELDRRNYDFRVKNALKLQLTGTASPNRLNITEGDESKATKAQKLQFTFKLLGENKYKAEIQVTITIPNKPHETEVFIKKVEPKQNCTLLSAENTESNHRVKCILTDLQPIIIDTEAVIHDIKDTTERITATAELSFDENIYKGQDMRMKDEVEVVLTKLRVVKSTAPIIGGTTGGILLLIIIIVVLIKCGFFRRRRHLERTQSTTGSVKYQPD
ncbi:integrin alpha-E [Salminus brasiliensis]|uniref:integrin alpha-E n=1 Tax=Salminus brasiliensis TaxID=930266 RepID=UPI003B82D776